MADIQQVCGQVYEETARLYADCAKQLGEAAAGYEILYGPAKPEPEILFLGYQPGGLKSDAAPGLDAGILLPLRDECVYASAEWRLARQMRNIWPTATLKRSNGLNAIFFRSPSVAVWKKVPIHLRQKLDEFSERQAKLLVEAIQPKSIIALGLGTFKKLAGFSGKVILPGERGALVVEGEIWDKPALGIKHLSGARISSNDMQEIRNHFAG